MRPSCNGSTNLIRLNVGRGIWTFHTEVTRERFTSVPHNLDQAVTNSKLVLSMDDPFFAAKKRNSGAPRVGAAREL